jgi:toxin CcdB
MAQFSLHRNLNPSTRAAIPYLLDIQNDLLHELGTRVVIPVFRRTEPDVQPITRLTPEIEWQGDKYIVMTPQLAGISVKELGPIESDLSRCRQEIVAAMDLLVSGF